MFNVCTAVSTLPLSLAAAYEKADRQTDCALQLSAAPLHVALLQHTAG
jgi:hypothetical protein